MFCQTTELIASWRALMHASLQTTDAVYAVLTPDDVAARIGNLGKGPAPEHPLVDDAVLDLLAAKLSEKLKGRLA